MTEDGAQLNFCELLERHGHIRIPLIQRDFAQGRTDQKDVREEFLEALHHALCLPTHSEVLPLNLDFIYGSVEGQTATRFQPLDGQQRLTTLFLLHWYLAWQDECSELFRSLCSDGEISRFSYQVRQSSTEFFDALVVFTPSCLPTSVRDVSSLISDQPWYFRNWQLDPTIRSSLVMLDAIHARFRNEHGLFARLTDRQYPAVTFQLLDLRHFGLSDDLYIKMNARGKPLTPFETFKARYEQTLVALFDDETRLLDGYPVSTADFFSRRMDTRWADFFWPHRAPDSDVFDAAVMNLFRAIILITRSPQNDKFVNEVLLLRNRDCKSSYSYFNQHNWLDRSFSEMFITLLETWSAEGSELARQLPNGRYFDEMAVFDKLLSDTTSLSYEEIVQLAAYAQFLKAHSDLVDPTVFQEWMRVVFNLSVNTEYNRPADLQRSLASLAELAPQMTSILEYLAQSESVIGGFSQLQVSEEQVKARLLLADDDWQPLIDQAEAHGYFRGQIGFLLRFSGVSTHPAAQGKGTWDATEACDLRVKFSDFLQKAAVMFDRSGLGSLPDCRWERALLVCGDYLLPNGQNHSFLANSQENQTSWKRFLRGAASGSPQGEVLQGLWEQLSKSSDLLAQLDAVIDGAVGLEEWRTAFIATPAAISYCTNRMIRRTESGVIYLLRKSQMNGSHAELFTYCLYEDVLKPASMDGRLKALAPLYIDSYTTDDAPGVDLVVSNDGLRLPFFLNFQANQYLVTFSAQEQMSVAVTALLKDLGFAEEGGIFIKQLPMEGIADAILAMDQSLAARNKVSD